MDAALPFDEDKYVRAVQFIPGDSTVLHHLLTYVTQADEDFDGGEADQRSIERSFLYVFEDAVTVIRSSILPIPIQTRK